MAFWKRPSVFISYSRRDVPMAAGRLRDALEKRLGDEAIFRDKDDIAGGAKWQDVIDQRLGPKATVLALIGPNWEAIKSEAEKENRADWNRMEIETAFARGARVIPVLVDRDEMPAEARLPTSIKQLASINASKLRDGDWDSDVERLRKLVAPGTVHWLLAAAAAAVVVIVGGSVVYYYDDFFRPASIVELASTAARTGNTEQIRAILKRGLKPDHVLGVQGNTMAHIAADSCRLDVLKLLKANDANLDLRNRSGATPLEIAKSRCPSDQFEKLAALFVPTFRCTPDFDGLSDLFKRLQSDERPVRVSARDALAGKGPDAVAQIRCQLRNDSKRQGANVYRLQLGVCEALTTMGSDKSTLQKISANLTDTDMTDLRALAAPNSERTLRDCASRLVQNLSTVR